MIIKIDPDQAFSCIGLAKVQERLFMNVTQLLEKVTLFTDFEIMLYIKNRPAKKLQGDQRFYRLDQLFIPHTHF